jgi:hypothetical protein
VLYGIIHVSHGCISSGDHKDGVSVEYQDVVVNTAAYVRG